MSKTKTQPKADEVVEEAVEAKPSTVTPAELALAFGTDPKTMRRFLRNVTQAKAGKGGRWAISTDLVPELKTRWENRSASATVTELPVADDDEELTDEVDSEEIEELDDIDG